MHGAFPMPVVEVENVSLHAIGEGRVHNRRLEAAGDHGAVRSTAHSSFNTAIKALA